MVDEAHERNLNSDAILGLLKKIRRKRKDLRIILCSATIDAQDFFNIFVKISTTGAQTGKRKRRWGPAKGETEEEEELLTDNGTISVDGRQHSVDILYLDKPTSRHIRSMVDATLRICDDTKGGDMLCFLPSGEEVDRIKSIVRTTMTKLCFCLYMELPPSTCKHECFSQLTKFKGKLDE
jgi:ATP-dependent RNA helicase DDX35